MDVFYVLSVLAADDFFYNIEEDVFSRHLCQGNERN